MDSDPLKQLQLCVIAEGAEEEAAVQEWEQLVRDIAELEAGNTLLKQEVLMRQENTARINQQIAGYKQMMPLLESGLSGGRLTEQTLRTAVADQEEQIRWTEKEKVKLEKDLNEGPADLTAQLEQRLSELNAEICEKQRVRDVRDEIRRQEQLQQNSRSQNDDWSSKVTIGDESGSGRLKDADDELRVVLQEKQIGMEWIDDISLSLD